MTLSNEQWVHSWEAADRKRRYALVEREARAVLTDEPISTWVLAEAIFPEASARGAGNEVRRSMVHMLLGLAKNTMSDCAYKDLEAEPKQRFGHTIRPWLWKRGTVVRHPPCPHCQGKGFLVAEVAT